VASCVSLSQGVPGVTVVAWLLLSTVLVEGPVTWCWSRGVERPVFSRRPESAKRKPNQLHYRLVHFFHLHTLFQQYTHVTWYAYWQE